MIGSLQVFPQGMAINGDAVLEHHLCLVQRQCVPFYRIAVIGRQETEILVKSLHRERLHWAIRIELILLLHESPGKSRLHSCLMHHRSLLSAFRLNSSTRKYPCSNYYNVEKFQLQQRLIESLSVIAMTLLLILDLFS